MAKKLIFKGIATALITPLNENGVDFDKLGKLIDWQIEQGIDGLVICGTTGEAATMDDKEHLSVLDFAAQRINGRTAMIAGTGSNDTAHAIAMTKEAKKLGADAALLVTPYYNKTTQSGLIASFTATADAVDLPVLLYNVPSRTGVNIEPETYAKMADHPNIVGIKEANGNISKIVETAKLVGDKLAIYSGNDDQIVPMLSVGAMGCISVLSNVLPKETCEITKKFFAGDVAGAAQLQFKYLDLINALFSEVNPIPAKAAMAKMGFCENYLRLPLVPMESAHEVHLIACMKEAGINV